VKTLLRVGILSPEAGKMRQKELSIHGENDGTTPRTKMPFDISSMVPKQDLMVFVEDLFHLKTDVRII